MPGIALVGIDVAGGVQLGLQAPNFRVNGSPVVVQGDLVAPHFPLEPLHIPAPFMAEGSPNWRINGIPVCRAGHLANCGHATSGRPFFTIP